MSPVRFCTDSRVIQIQMEASTPAGHYRVIQIQMEAFFRQPWIQMEAFIILEIEYVWQGQNSFQFGYLPFLCCHIHMQMTMSNQHQITMSNQHSIPQSMGSRGGRDAHGGDRKGHDHDRGGGRGR